MVQDFACPKFKALADIGGNFGDVLRPKRATGSFSERGFECLGEEFLWRTVTTRAKVRLDYLLVFAIKGKYESRDSVQKEIGLAKTGNREFVAQVRVGRSIKGFEEVQARGVRDRASVRFQNQWQSALR